MKAACIGAILALAPISATSQTLTGSEAERQLFSPRGVSIAVSRQLSEPEQTLLRTMFDPDVLRQAGASFVPVYYGSIAYSPDEGLQSEALQGAYNFHSTAASDAMALAACNAARAAGTRPCAIAGQILPRRYERRPLTLSAAATSVFSRTYRQTREPKAMAVSQRTGAYSVKSGDGAAETAVAECNRSATAMNGPADCVAVISD